MVKLEITIVALLAFGFPVLGLRQEEAKNSNDLRPVNLSPQGQPANTVSSEFGATRSPPAVRDETINSNKLPPDALESLLTLDPLRNKPLPINEQKNRDIKYNIGPRPNITMPRRRLRGIASEEEMDQQRIMSEKYHERENAELSYHNHLSHGAHSSSDRVVVGYYADWKARDLPPEKIPYAKLTHINYAFAIIKEDTMEPYFETDHLLPRVVKSAHENNVKVLLSVGGWTGSKHFSPIVADSSKRTTLVAKLVELTNKFELDGIDIDWEFPGRLGLSCNAYNSANDSDNFIVLLRELRMAMDEKFSGTKKLITLAVRVEPIDGPTGPIADASELAAAVDFINVMAYDINGPWSSTTGPNAPLRHRTGKGFQLSFMSAVKSWLGAKFPNDKLVMGLAFYGRSFQVKQETRSEDFTKGESFYMPFSKTVPQGDGDDAMWSDPCPGAPNTFSGVWQWKNLRQQGFLRTPTIAGPEWFRFYDEVTHTPWLYSSTKKSSDKL
ncbi:hypothetical protein DSO57_1027880 [Entomophthora muscae]|uniref:Uncharacterized protein n=1 Tax=Entomophthora muscae TaxID=34485 RepID=A0ACC2TZT4_9FUNG|nr:hypothetical protein DSO57_1027880 [Entomophthora muscae]